MFQDVLKNSSTENSINSNLAVYVFLIIIYQKKRNIDLDQLL